MSRTETATTATQAPAGWLRPNGWPVLPLRAFLAGLFGFAGYAKLTYPGFFDPNSANGLKASVDAVKRGTPLGGALGPLSSHPSLFGHITAGAEIAIALGLLFGLLTRIAAFGGMVLTALIVLSINWSGVKEYTGSSGWFTSVDLAVAAGLSVFLLGGAGPLSLDGLISWRRARRHARDDAEPSFRDSELDDSRRRLQGHPDDRADQRGAGELRTDQLPVPPVTETRPEPEPGSLWSEGRRDRQPVASEAATGRADSRPAVER